MVRSDLIDQLVAAHHMPRVDAEKIVVLIFEAMADELANGERIEIRGFGSFAVREYAGYTGRNPKTGEPVWVPPKRLPFFKTGKDLAGRIRREETGASEEATRDDDTPDDVTLTDRDHFS